MYSQFHNQGQREADILKRIKKYINLRNTCYIMYTRLEIKKFFRSELGQISPPRAWLIIF